MLILLFYTLALCFKLINHIFCAIKPSITPILGIVFLFLFLNSLTVALSLFAIRLKEVFKGTMYEPSDTLFRTLIASVVIFVIIGLVPMVLYLLDNAKIVSIRKDIAQMVETASVMV